MAGDQLVLRKRGNHSGPDFLSDLPLGIIHCILERVPIREAVRTCILSRRWRYIWATLPNLVFEKDAALVDWKDLKTFITNVLFLHKGPIHKFRLEYRLSSEDDPDIDRWLLCLSRNEIRDLFLGNPCSDLPFRVHSSVYSCLKLTHLALYGCILPPPPPTFKAFSYLRSLILHHVKMPFEIVESLVSNSPFLENFTMLNGIPLDISELRISAPNLKLFKLRGEFEEISLYAPLVTEVTVLCDQEEDVFAAKSESSVCNFTKFLGGFANLESLTSFWSFTKYLSIGIKSYDHSLVFHHLKFLRLHYFSFEDEDQLAVIGHLMMGAPNLMSLSISPGTYISALHHTPYPDFGCGPNFAFNNLRYIIMDELRCAPCEMEIIQYLLKSSPVLETMELYSLETLEPEAESSLMGELLCYCRASPNAKVLTCFGE